MTREELKIWAEAHPNMPQAIEVRILLSYTELQDKAIKALTTEIKRLRRGDLTMAEFHELCHNLEGKPGLTEEEFERGCREYREKLFGKAKPLTEEAIRDLIAAKCKESRRLKFSEIAAEQITAEMGHLNSSQPGTREQGCSNKPDTTSESPETPPKT